jgi:hypothetical protein
MPRFVPGIRVLHACCFKDVDGRDKPGHDEVERSVPAFTGIRHCWRVGGRPPAMALRDGQFPHACYAQIARRAKMSQAISADFHKSP